MHVRLLGPLEVSSDGVVVPLPAGRARVVLATLALNTGLVVGQERLVEAAWSGNAPATAPTQVQSMISALRRRIAEARRGPVIETVESGYRLALPPGAVDALRFRAAIGEARDARRRGDHDAAVRHFGEALGLWRGPALEGLASGYLEYEARLLEQQRMSAVTDHAAELIAMGEFAPAAEQLAASIAADPANEELTRLAMVALRDAGRRTEAMAAYRALRKHLVSELGIEPGRQVRELHEQLLADAGPEPRPAAAAQPRPPAHNTLPRDLGDFTGRTSETARLLAVIQQQRPTALPLAAVYGMAGVGKTALAVHAGHLSAGCFPDGLLFVDLHGHTPGTSPTEPADALRLLLTASGLDAAHIPADPVQRGAAWRARVAGRRVLVILDNAADAAQVRPLLPGTADAAVIVTSRKRLVGLEGARHVDLDTFAADTAHALFSQIAGPERAQLDPVAVDEVLTNCAGLPLAIRIIAARFAARPDWSGQDLLDRLVNARRILDEFVADDLGVRATFNVSYLALTSAEAPSDRAAARAFTLLGLWNGVDLPREAVAALLGQDGAQAGQSLDRLIEAHLVLSRTQDRVLLHDLLRTYSAETAAAELSAAERDDATARLLAWWLHAADAAVRVLAPHQRKLPVETVPAPAEPLRFGDADQALAWLDRERENLVAAVRQAAATGHDAIGWMLPRLLDFYFDRRALWDDWTATARIAVECARRLGDPRLEGQTQLMLSVACRESGDLEQARDACRWAMERLEAVGEDRGLGAALDNMGIIHQRFGDLDAALDWYQKAMPVRRRVGLPYGIACTLNQIAVVQLERGCLPEAIDAAREALEACQDRQTAFIKAATHDTLASAYTAAGDYEPAAVHYRQAIDECAALADHRGQAVCLENYAEMLQRTGELETARQHWQQALAILEEHDLPGAERISERIRQTS